MGGLLLRARLHSKPALYQPSIHPECKPKAYLRMLGPLTSWSPETQVLASAVDGSLSFILAARSRTGSLATVSRRKFGIPGAFKTLKPGF